MKLLTVLLLLNLPLLFSCNESASDKKSLEEKKPDTTITKKKYKPEQPIKFDHSFQTNDIKDCSLCHTNYTEKDTIKLKDLNENKHFNVSKDSLKFKHPKSLGDISNCSKCHY